ncbi:S9 family peptidase [Polluticaenibacter yanchengensis]|uniref:S9 family peptidase n=1 Tax=Polluticaenibacter yanchengensis TaxID=3014562 RepID=A0ABT4UMZ6_9BACT|nr:S9 family peptidase [Chitinophagaceae bacterium LY-5]
MIGLRLRCVMLFLVTASTITVFAQKKVITHESLWAMKRVGAPAISPNGKWVVYSVQDPSYDPKLVKTDLWIVATDKSVAPRKLTDSKASEAAYTWAPASDKIAFTSKKEDDEVSQVYILDIANGGEAQKITNLSSGASAPVFSPDGKKILFTSRVYAKAFEDSVFKKMDKAVKDRKYKARVYTSFPVRDFDQWIDEKQTHVYIQDAVPNAVPTNLFKHINIVNEQGFAFSGKPVFSPDGQTILIAATTESTTAAYREPANNIYAIDVKTGKEKLVIANNGNSYSEPALSADGTVIYFTNTIVNNGKLYNEGRLYKASYPAVQNIEKINIPDNPVVQYVPTPKGIYVVQDDSAKYKVLLVANDGKTWSQFTPNEAASFTNVAVSENGEAVVASYESAVAPPEIALLKNKQSQLLSEHNKAVLAALDYGTVEDFWFKSKQGKQIHNLLVKPANFDPNKKYPLFVLMHGGPASAFRHNYGYRWNYQLLASDKYVIVMTNYTGSTGFGEAFANSIQFDPFKTPAEEILQGAEEAIKKYSFIDANKQFAGGASYGGHMANWMGVTTTHFKCLISHAGLFNSESQWGSSDVIYGRELMNGGTPWMNTKTFKNQNPIRYAGNLKTPMLVTIGERDYRVPINNTLELWSALQRMKVPSKLLVFPDENHWILNAENSRFFYEQLHEWVQGYVK